MKEIFEYLSFREFLSDRITTLRARGEFSNREFAKQAGLKTTSFLRLLLKGQRNVTTKTAKKMAECLGLDAAEVKFFTALVEFNQSKDVEVYNQALLSLKKFKRLRSLRVLNVDEWRLFSEWYHVVVLEWIGKKTELRNLPEIAHALTLSLDKVKGSLQLLEDLKLIKITDSEILRTSEVIASPEVVKDLNARNFHVAMSKKAIEAVEILPTDEREFGSLTISLAKSQIKTLKDKLKEFRRELNLQFSEESQATAESREIYQINLQMFPLARFDDASELE